MLGDLVPAQVTEEQFVELGKMRHMLKDLRETEAALEKVTSRGDLLDVMRDVTIPPQILQRFVAELLVYTQTERLRLEDKWDKA